MIKPGNKNCNQPNSENGSSSSGSSSSKPFTALRHRLGRSRPKQNRALSLCDPDDEWSAPNKQWVDSRAVLEWARRCGEQDDDGQDSGVTCSDTDENFAPAVTHVKSTGSGSSSGASSCQDEAFSETWSDDRHEDETSSPISEERKLLNHCQQPRSLPVNSQHYPPFSSSPQSTQAQPHIVADHIITMHTRAPQLLMKQTQSHTLNNPKHQSNSSHQHDQIVTTRPGGRVRMSSCVDSCIWEESPTLDGRDHISPSHAMNSNTYNPKVMSPSTSPLRAATLDRPRLSPLSYNNKINASSPTNSITTTTASMTLGRLGTKTQSDNYTHCSTPCKAHIGSCFDLHCRSPQICSSAYHCDGKSPCNSMPPYTNSSPSPHSTTVVNNNANNNNLNKSTSSHEEGDKVSTCYSVCFI